MNNDHLKPVFEIILPALEQEYVGYWVYGGVSIAAHNGNFFRVNSDVDIFVLDTEFENAKIVLNEISKKNNFILKIMNNISSRSKLDMRIAGKERLSVIPVFKKDAGILFKYDDGDQVYSGEIMTKVEQNISGFRFYTPTNNVIKEMFINHLKARPDKVSRDKVIDDGRHLLSEEEFSNLFQGKSYKL